MNQGRDTTKEERLAIVKDCLASGKNYGEMAQKHQVSYRQVRTWTLKYEEPGAADLKTGVESGRGIKGHARSWKQHRLRSSV